jgi:hypothetical protein
MTQEPATQTKREEIDLFTVAEKGKKTVISIGKLIGRFVTFSALLLLRYYYLTIIAIIAGVFLGYLDYNGKSDTYSSEAIVYAYGPDNLICEQTIAQINHYLQNGEKQKLGKLLQIDEAKAKSILSIESFFGIDYNRDFQYDIIDYYKNFNAKDTTKKIVPGYLFLKIRTRDSDVNSEMLNKTTTFLNNDLYFKRAFALKRAEDSSMMTQYIYEAKSLDSIHTIQYKNPKTAKNTSSSSFFLMNEKEIKPLSPQIIQYTSMSHHYKNRLQKYTKPFTIIQDYSSIAVNEKAFKLKIIKWLFYCGLICYALCLIIFYRKTIINFYLKAKNL